MASRACNIGLCSRIINTWREHPLPLNLQKMLLAVGLRGAVAYGLGEQMQAIVARPGTDSSVMEYRGVVWGSSRVASKDGFGSCMGQSGPRGWQVRVLIERRGLK